MSPSKAESCFAKPHPCLRAGAQASAREGHVSPSVKAFNRARIQDCQHRRSRRARIDRGQQAKPVRHFGFHSRARRCALANRQIASVDRFSPYRIDERSAILISTMSLSAEIVAELSCGDARPFASWPDPAVPTFGAGVYTIWHKDGRLIYVGMSGRGITAETARRNTPQGIYTRLGSHASGRRSGDQFCVYVADRLVLPTLSQDDITAIGSGRHQMDAFVRRYIHENLCFRFVTLMDGAAAYAMESALKNGKWEHGRPLLNPAS